jgi:hypothetical protein
MMLEAPLFRGSLYSSLISFVADYRPPEGSSARRRR